MNSNSSQVNDFNYPLNWFRPQMRMDNGELTPFDFVTSKVICVGRNYLAHAKELNNPVPQEPLLFIKPNSALANLSDGIIPSFLDQTCHYETEVALLLGEPLTAASAQESLAAIVGVGLGLDLTLREKQTQLKQGRQPWEKSKAFDGSCPVSSFISAQEFANFADINFELLINGKRAQIGNSQDMLFPIAQLISEASHYFSLYPGDIIMTGTPAGVGKLQTGDKLTLKLQEYQWQTKVND